MNHSQTYLDVMLRFVRQAGVIALKNIHKSEPDFKADRTIVTKTDRAVSVFAHRLLAKILKQSDHILIDEEDPLMAQYLDEKILKRTEYIWSLDPIDGTRLYANGVPTFGISIGLLKNLKPWLGVVYFPMLNELFYCDGKNSYFVQRAFSTRVKKTRIVPIDQTISRETLFFCNDTFFRKFAWNDLQFHCMIQACAVVNLLWPAIGRGCGCFLRSSLWDFAGSWPIFRSAGLDLRHYKSGKVLDALDVNLFNREPKPWELRDYFMLSSERNYSLIKSKIVEISAQ